MSEAVLVSPLSAHLSSRPRYSKPSPQGCPRRPCLCNGVSTESPRGRVWSASRAARTEPHRKGPRVPRGHEPTARRERSSLGGPGPASLCVCTLQVTLGKEPVSTRLLSAQQDVVMETQLVTSQSEVLQVRTSRWSQPQNRAG